MFKNQTFKKYLFLQQYHFVAPHGFEPQYSGSKPEVLPLDDGAI